MWGVGERVVEIRGVVVEMIWSRVTRGVQILRGWVTGASHLLETESVEVGAPFCARARCEVARAVHST